MPQLTALEQGILDAFRQADAKVPVELVALLASATARQRDSTGYGFYTELEVDRTLPSADLHPMVDGPIAHVIGLGEGKMMGSILWLEDGYPATLEGFQYGDTTGANVDLHSMDLAQLAFSRIEWPELRPIS